MFSKATEAFIYEAIEDFIICYISNLVSEEYNFIIICKYSERTLRDVD